MTVATQTVTSIRQATLADRDRVLEMARAFLAGTAYGVSIPVVAAVLEPLVDRFLSGDAGSLFLADVNGVVVGQIAMLTYPNMVSGELTASEVIW